MAFTASFMLLIHIMVQTRACAYYAAQTLHTIELRRALTGSGPMLSESQSACLRKSVLFGALPEDVFQAIVAHAKPTAFKQGDCVCREGDKAHSVFCVANGAIKLTVNGRNGHEVVVDIFHAGTGFAEALLFRDETYPVSAEALVDSVVVVVPKFVIETELKAKPDTIPTLLAATYSHLHRLVRQIEHLKAASGVQRVAGFILTLADADKNTSVFEIPYKKQTIASMLGIEPETLSRAFKRLSKHGIDVRGPKIEVRDRSALEAFHGEV